MARLLKAPFNGKPHLSVLLDKFSQLQGQDHDPSFREVAISCSLSLHSPSSEVPPIRYFEKGFSCDDVNFFEILLSLLLRLGADPGRADALALAIADIGDAYNLGGYLFRNPNNVPQDESYAPGQMLQIFIRVDCVDDIAYGCQPFGEYDELLNPLSEYMTRADAPDGQARIFWHPSLFLDPTKTKVYHYAGDESVHERRSSLQSALAVALRPLVVDPMSALRAYEGIEGVAP
jgi:hypothetical protein